jgi:Dam-replacing HTH domain
VDYSPLSINKLVREQFRRVKSAFAELPVSLRGWTLDVLTVVRRLGARGSFRTGNGREVGGHRPPLQRGAHAPSRAVFGAPAEHIPPPPSPIEFSNEDVYAFERELEALHPGNRHIRDKIRQQLQVLRDRGLLVHVGRNRWKTV